MELKDLKRIYFIGIGGIGMSALARYFNGRGIEVHGYDLNQTNLTEQLSKEGMHIHYDEDLSKIPEAVDLVVFTPAVPDSHEELVWFREQNYPVMKRAEILGLISRGMKTIAIAGTHGKTTTSTMVTHVLRSCGLDCSAFLGGIAGNFDSNFVEGKSEWVVVEADEYDRSFLQLSPDIATVSSIDADHLDIYETAEFMENAYREFLLKVKPDGKVFVNQKIKKKLVSKEVRKKVDINSFGQGRADIGARKVRVKKGQFVFDIRSIYGDFDNVELPMPGKHNVENATAAISIALHLGLKKKKIMKALAGFKGVKRRFEFIIREKKLVFIDDYAHHPEELNSTIKAARNLYPKKKITGVFQPHLFSRTKDFATEFAAALDQLDACVLLGIYPAREEPIPGISSMTILEQMENQNAQMLTKNELADYLINEEIDVLMTMGAGDIDKLVPEIAKILKHK
ncbi:MAG: UDP-N-acetylmuramate--L-alanine ligase [Bacteroidota bacterium]